MLLGTSALSLSIVTSFFSTVGVGKYTSDVPFLVNLPVETFLVILYVPCHVQFQLCLAFHTPSLHSSALSQVASPCFLYLGICFFHFSLTNSSLLNNTDLLLSLPNFWILGISNSCVLWNTSLQICYLYNDKYLVTYKWHT